MTASPHGPHVNPFATSRVRPGAIDFLFPPEVDAAQLVRQLATWKWRAQIVGPHGTGKSTLLAALRQELQGIGKPFIHVALHDGQRQLPAELRHPSPDVLTIIDGFEQLGAWWRWWLLHGPVWRKRGLLITTHASMGLPTLWRTEVTPQLAQRVLERLAPAGDATISAADVEQQLARHGGDLRAALFGLYDLYELRKRS